jgi:two-component system sensor histidine kinase SenX3
VSKRSELQALRGELERARQDRDAFEAAAQSAQREAAQLRAAFDALPIGVVVVDDNGTETLRNEEATRLRDARQSDVLAAQALTDVLAEAVTGPAERVVDLHGPPPRTWSVAALPLRTSGGGRVAVIQDVTDRYRIDAVRRDFVANVSHELRTPIGAIVALADTLTVEDDTTDPEVLRRLAARVAHEAERAGHLIDDLLDLSRIEGGELEREEVTVRQLVARAVDRVVSSAGERADDVAIGDIDDVTLLVDTTQIETALVNLIENAIKYSNAGAAVVVTARAAGPNQELAVRDHGIGIPPSDRDRIFERFYRVDRARSRATGGTGLGLAIVRHVARNHGGDVTVESREGEGSTFVVQLPIATTDQTAK